MTFGELIEALDGDGLVVTDTEQVEDALMRMGIRSTDSVPESAYHAKAWRPTATAVQAW